MKYWNDNYWDKEEGGKDEIYLKTETGNPLLFIVKKENGTIEILDGESWQDQIYTREQAIKALKEAIDWLREP